MQGWGFGRALPPRRTDRLGQIGAADFTRQHGRQHPIVPIEVVSRVAATDRNQGVSPLLGRSLPHFSRVKRTMSTYLWPVKDSR